MKKKQPIKMVYPLAPMQEGILFHSLYNSESEAYFEQMTIFAEGKLDQQLFEKAFNLLIERYDILRTIFVYENIARPRQVVLNKRAARITFKDLTILEGDAKKAAIKEFKEKDRKNKFNLSKDLLMRMAILQLEKDRYEIIWSYHHILMDGWCMGIIMSDFLTIYRSLINNEELQLGKVYPYGDYIKWLEKQNKNAGLNYWKEYLQDYDHAHGCVTAEIPKKSSISDKRDYIHSEATIELGKDLTKELMELSRRNEVTLNTVFQTIWGILLQKYNNVDDVVFGSVVSGRPSEIKGIEKMVGLFINTIPVRIKNNRKDTFSEIVKKVQKQAFNSEKYSYQPLAEIQANSELKQNLLNHIVVFENYPLEKEVKNQSDAQELPFKFKGLDMTERTNYNFDVVVSPSSNMIIKLCYNGAVYDKDFVDKIDLHLKKIINEVICNDQLKIENIDILTDEEKERLLIEFNNTQRDYDKNKTLHQLFEEQVAKTPDQTALILDQHQMTYRELNAKANQLARILRNKNVQADTIVGMMLEPSIEMVIGILGVLKAGGAYLPISSEYPEQRIQWILSDSKVEILLTQSFLAEEIKFNGELLQLDDENLYTSDIESLENINQPNDLAYILYTSGTTGRPKGVMVEHQSVVNLLDWFNDSYHLNDSKNVLQMTSYTFDPSVEQIFGTLCYGSTLHLIKQEVKLDKELFRQYVETNQIQIVDMVPSLMKELLIGEDKMDSIEVLISGGEKLDDFVKDELISKGYQIYNHYGLTETTVEALVSKCSEGKVVLGKPIANTKCLVLDKDNNLVPVGVSGEICISGECLARGYLNNIELTNEKFISNPFEIRSTKEETKKMYKTGDLGRWLPDGTIEYSGRIDSQVKIRGFRIELSEIEYHLALFDGVTDLVVVDYANEEGNAYLCAYIVTEKKLVIEEIREFLSDKLPSYMIPAHFVQLEKIPLTSNGKIDRKALPAPDENFVTREYVAPENAIQQKLAEIWSEILGVEKVGITDNFFEIGGHSLKATSFISRVNKELNVELPMRDVFKTPTIKKLASKIAGADESIYSSIEKVTQSNDGLYPISSAQKRLFLINKLEENSIHYNMPTILKIEGEFDKKHFEEVLKRLVNRHDAFRTSFIEVDGNIVQKIDADVEFKIQYTQCDDHNMDIGQLVKEFVRPFDLSQAPLFRVGLLEHSDSYILIMDMHHIISDGTSMSILINEFINLYTGNQLPELRIQYKDFAVWQNNLFNSEEIEKQKKYWLKRFDKQTQLPVLTMPTDYPRPSILSFEGELLNFEIDQELADKLNQLSKKHGATLFMVLLAAYNLLLAKYTGQEDLIVGTPISGRPHADLEKIIGMFVNTLAIRNHANGMITFAEFLKDVKENALMAYENQDYQFEMLVEKLDLRRELSRNPLFDTMFILQNFDRSTTGQRINDLKFSPYEFKSTVSKFDLSLTASEWSQGIKFSLEYCTKLFKRETMERLAGHFVNILKVIAQNPGQRLIEVDMLSNEEIEQLFYDFNSTQKEYPANKTIQQLFEEQVIKTPDQIALVFEDQKLTYDELNNKANQLARLLHEKCVTSDQIIGIMMERSVEMIISMLAVLKAGAAYLPIDPTYPEARIEYMLTDSNAELLLTQDKFIDQLNYTGERIGVDTTELSDYEENNLPIEYSSRDLAYVIYTSGSTGKPKGVMIEHQGIANLTNSFKDDFAIKEDDRIIQFASCAFDASVSDIYMALLFGATLYIISKDIINDYRKFESYINENSITAVILPPVYLNHLSLEKNQSLKRVITGGSATNYDLVNRWREKVDYFNVYGPTESSVFATVWKAEKDGTLQKNIPIGKPISNTKIYILDQNQKPVPMGVVGELCIAGEGLARGYLNRSDLTEERFIQNEFVGERIYRTGDLARWLTDGNIEFIGRIDNQVKIRGYRIELGEIEQKLLEHEDILENVVIDKIDQTENKYLVAYYVAERELPLTELKTYLSRELPEYMVPSYFVQLDKMPLTPNGKIDKKALPDLIKVQTKEYLAPPNATEERLAKIWSEILGIEKVGVLDNFFENGGHSLKAISMISRVAKEFNIELPLKEIFKNPTIQELAEFMTKAHKSNYSSIKEVEVREYYPLSSAQKRLYILNQLEGSSTSYNMPGAIKIIGDLDQKRFETVIKELVQRHDAFRTSFEMVDGQVVQKIHQDIDFEVNYLHVSEAPVEDLIKEFIRPFNLSQASLLRVGLIASEDENILVFDMHHIISDGVSMNILTNDFIKLYSGLQLSDLRIQYKDFSVWQNDLFKSEKINQLEEYWLTTFSDNIPVLNLPTDFPRPAVMKFIGDQLDFSLGEEEAVKLHDLIQDHGVTLYMFILAAFNILLSKYSGQEDIVIGSPIAGRPHADLEKIIGMFVNTLAMRNHPIGTITFAEFLEQVKDGALNAFENQDYQFEMLVEKLDHQGQLHKDLSRNPLFDVMFVLQNTQMQTMQLQNSEAQKVTAFDNLAFAPYSFENKVAKFDLTLTAYEVKDDICFSLNYSTQLFKKESIKKLANHLKKIISEIVKNPMIELKEIQMITPEEKQQLVHNFASADLMETKVVDRSHKTANQIFEEQVAKTPENIAVIYGEEQLTYRELNDKANQLAHVLRKNGVKSDEIVGIMVERSFEMMIGILAILKAGGAYLPIDPNYPIDRIEYILNDSQASVLLTKDSFNTKIADIFTGAMIDLTDESLYSSEGYNLEIVNKPQDLAYVLYTSGSTGKPKGVMVEHHSLVNTISHMQQKYPLNANDTILQSTVFTFDASVREILWWFFNGAKCYLLEPDGEKYPIKIIDAIATHQITVVKFVPILFNEFLTIAREIIGYESKLSSLNYVFVGGEALPGQMIDKFYQVFPAKKQLVNLYGPTETTIHCTEYEICQSIDNKYAPIGRPISNNQIYLLDQYLNPVPVGVAGEIYISGAGVARGYLNNPKLTDEQFIQSPFDGERMYRSGDIGRWLADGNLEFLSRTDHQVKIRGFRIELGEIENQLLKHALIEEAVVIDIQDENGGKYLCGYIVAGEELPISVIKVHLQTELPDYMIPAYFVQLEKLPLTWNGKVDRKALPKPESTQRGVEYVAPRDRIEATIARIWSDILGVGRVSIDDNFFEIGGHSLKATSFIAKAFKDLNVEIPLRQIFKTPNIRELAEFVKGAEESIYSSLKVVEPGSTYPVSSAQKRLYILNQMNHQTTTYNMPMAIHIEGPLDVGTLEKSFGKLIQRHEALRTSFEMIDGVPVQKVHNDIVFHIDRSEVSGEVNVKEFIRPFDLNHAPLLRASLITNTGIADRYTLVFDMHHIISDAVSMNLLINDVMQIYNGEELPDLKYQYKDFSSWQNELFNSEKIEKQAEYWLDQFSGEIPVLNMPTDYQRSSLKNFQGDFVTLELDEKLTAQLNKLMLANGVTLYMMLLAAYDILLSKYSGQEDIIIGSPIAGRPHADLENIIGVFINTLAMRNYPVGEKTFIEFLNEVKETALGAYENQDYQFEMLVEKLYKERSLITGRNPLFDVMFSLQNATDHKNQIVDDLKITPFNFENKLAKFDLTLTAIEGQKNIYLTWNYSTQLFKEETIERLARHFESIVREIIANPMIELKNIQMIAPEEKKQLLQDFAIADHNQTNVENLAFHTIPAIFEQQVQKTPENIALIFGEEHLTYRELNEKANQLAHVLRKQGVRPDDIVGIMVERSFEMMIGILAILKAGGAYLPIDPNYPFERIEYILSDSEACILLTMDLSSTKLEFFKGEVIDLKDESLYSAEGSNLELINKPENLAYVLYTSGSTGKPKGVMIEHGSLVNTISHMQKKYPLNENDTILQSTVFTFDASVREIVWWFFNGAKCYLLEPDGEKFPTKIIDAIDQYQITVVKFVPILLNEFLTTAREIDGYESKLSSLSYIFVGGEALPGQMIDNFYQVFPTNKKLVNLYGPTETTIHCTEYEISQPIGDKYAPIGRPIINDQIYVLDQYLNPLPVGVAGEIYISGVGVARGYLNNQELTEERFIQSPFDSERMYKSGDIGRWLADGNLEFLSRVDHQIKIRGFRIELGEIENQLLKHELIQEAVVVDIEDKNGSKYLCGYIVAEGELSDAEIKAYLQKELPDYMIPASIVKLEKLPLTWNGKVDRKALPKPDNTSGTEYISPSGRLEETMARIWSDILRVDRVSVEDNFFEIGGHSLKATSFIAKAFKELNVEIPLREVFTHPTIKELAAYVNTIQNESMQSFTHINKVDQREYYPLSSAQKRLYILNQLEGISTSYNMPGIYGLSGIVDRKRIQDIFKKLTRRHESLRTSFDVREGEVVQIIHDDVDFEIIDLQIDQAGDQANRVAETNRVIKGFIKPFDLSKAPLFRVGLIQNNEESILIFDMHHIISDGESRQILVKDFINLYTSKELPELRVQYKDYAVWQRDILNSQNNEATERIHQQEEYWLKTFTDERTETLNVPVLNLSTDYPRPSVMSFEGDSIQYTLGKELTEKINEMVRSKNVTLYMVLLSAYNILLSKYSGQEDIVVGSPTSGRLHADLENIIGMFINTLPIRNYPDNAKGFAEFLAEVKENVLDAFDNQDYQFDMLVEKLDLHRDLSRNPLFDTMFTLQNFADQREGHQDSELVSYNFSTKIAKFDLSLTAIEGKEQIQCSFEYSTKLFKKSTIERMVKHFENIVTTIVENPEIPIAEIEMITDDERVQILSDFNNTQIEYPTDQTLHQLFAEQVVKTPNQNALVLEDQWMTYQELDQRSTCLAKVLRKKGIGRDQIVGMLVEPSFEMVIGIFAILKAGGAYLPIDPGYPEERIKYILDDSKPAMILTQSIFLNQIQFDGERINLDELDLSECVSVENVNQSNDLAYIIYTSGSTGRPKGVMVEHRSVVNLVNWYNTNYLLNEDQNVLQMTNNTFDPAVEQIFGTLCHGSTLHLIKQEVKLNKELFRRYLEEHQIHIVDMVPSAMKELLLGEAKIDPVKVVISGGEKLDDHVKDQLIHLGYNVYNHYGLTETTVEALVVKCSAEKVVLGRPLSNTKCYILDKQNHLLPVGVVGEICIAGDCLARGYLNKDELTKERFIQNPVDSAERMYKTGDLGRWLSDGTIEFVGRTDTQVKIRGFRIELAEIEHHLTSYQSIRESVVIDLEDQAGNKSLCAYMVADSDVSISDLRGFLVKELPNYMIPSHFVQLEKLPLTSNGKIDRKALPKPDGAISTTEYVAPSNDIEAKLVTIWSDILGVKKIGVTDNFFEIGGHSLKATSFIAKAFKELNVEIPLREVFTHPTIKELAAYVNIIQNVSMQSFTQIKKVDQRKYYPLSSAQNRLYILNQLEGNSTNYNMPGALKIKGSLTHTDKKHLQDTFKKLIKRHEAFRTSFEVIDGEVVQIIHDHVEFEIIDLTIENDGADRLIKEFIQPFDLSKAPLFRVGLINSGADENILVYDMHHIISDGASMNIVTTEFSKLFAGQELPDLRIQYKDYSVWQNDLLNSEVIQKQEEYWLRIFGDSEIPVLNMPSDYFTTSNAVRPAVMTFEGERLHFTVEKELSMKLNGLARDHGATLFMVLLSAYNLLLSKYSGQEDVIVGSPIAGRSHADLENIIGMFVNTLAMRNNPQDQLTFVEFLEQVKENSLAAFENQDYQFEMLVDKLNLGRDLSRNPLFDTMFVLQNLQSQTLQSDNHDQSNGVNNSDSGLVSYAFENRIAKFDLTLNATEFNQGVQFTLEYRTQLFKRETMQRLVGHFVNILTQITENPDQRLMEVEILSNKEKEQLIYDFNNTQQEYPANKTIHHLFEEQVTKAPDQIALVYNDQKLTYLELNKKANQLARLLRETSVKSDQIVGVMMERSVEMIISMIAVLKAGVAYLPIDPSYPEARIEYMLSDSNTRLLLTQDKLSDKLNFIGELITVDELDLSGSMDTNLSIESQSIDLAYVIYTSGSTGKPKGVMIEHKGIANLKNSWKDDFGLTQDDRIIQFASCAFDASVSEVYMALLFGATLYVISQDIISDYGKFESYLNENGITTVTLPPMYLNHLSLDNIHSLKRVITAGSATNYDMVNRWREKVDYINAYGPTETTICATVWKAKKDGMLNKNIPIGMPISNTQVYILDHHLKPVPIGVIGELCVAGEGLARGYLNRPDLTAERFVQSEFIGERIYRTGDMVRWLADGTIEFIGRADHQVKIRGYRIEPGEIEQKLLEHKDIRETVVVDHKDNTDNRYLVAYYVTERELSVNELRIHLSKELPEYMIPSYFVYLDQMPLTPNGKIDKKALPEPHRVETRGYVAPSTEMEERLVSIWSEVLGVDQIGIVDNFFEMGGHSLKAISMISKVSKEFNVELSLKEVFKQPTVKGLVEFIHGAQETIYSSINKVDQRAYYPLSSAQKRLYVLNQLEGISTSYNMPGIYGLNGIVDRKRIQDIFKKLTRRHESLRTSFDVREGEVVQIIHDDVDFEIIDLQIDQAGDQANRVVETNRIIKGFIKPFDLSKAPLFRVGLIQNNEESILIFDMHHIISDGESMQILVKDFVNLYSSKELPELRIQYKDYAVWHRDILNSENNEGYERIHQQEEYWLKTFTDERTETRNVPVLNLSTDYPRPSVMSFEGDSIQYTLGKELTEKINEMVRSKNVTLYMVLLSAYNILLSKYSGQEDLVVGSPTSGRLHVDLENIIGMFINTLPMRNYPDNAKQFAEFLAEVRENVLDAFDNQDYQFDMLVEKLDLQRDLSRNPLFDTMFTLQNFADQKDDHHDSELVSFNFSNKIAKFDLSLTAVERKDQIQCSFEYSTKLFKKSTIERMVKHFENIVTVIVENPEILIAEIEMISDEERVEILNEFNNTQVEYPTDQTLHQLFAEQVVKTPDQTALVLDDQWMTYQELDQKSTYLAKVLREKGIGRDQIVGMLVEPSFEMFIGIFAILKAGGAYLPIDPGYPEERIKYILDDSKPTMILTQSTFVDQIQFYGEWINLDELDLSERVSVENINQSNDLAYIIYTSGSTGRPKGVMVEHMSVVNLVNWYSTNYLLNEDKNVLQMTNYTFDPAVEQIFGTLCHGSTLHLIKQEVKLNKEMFRRYLEEHQIHIIDMVPSAMKELLLGEAKIGPVQVVISGGEKLDDHVKDQLIHLRYNVYNHYGLTETTVEALVTKCSAEKVVLGRPVSNTKCYILDQQNHLLPVGVVGEICIAGDCLARGYLNKEELTKERFIQNPVDSAERMYKTGDLGRWLPDGTIEFDGRIDNQVKIRGFRIELAEIEHHLTSYQSIRESVVIDLEDQAGNKYLCAYMVADSDVSVTDIRSFLAKELPNYMIPSHFVQLEKLPLTSNGKIDRKALPKPDGAISTTEYVAPSNDIEEKLVTIWSAILGMKQVGVTNNFFEIGGHSLKATSLITEIYKEFKIDLPLREIFRTPTVRELAGYIQKVEDEIQYPKDDNLVLLRRGTDDLNLFFVHGGDGEIEGYLDLAERLNPEFNCWGIRADRLSHYSPKNVSIEEMAEKYIEKIKGVQEVGPYHIAGWSLGGIIVFEMVKHLEQMGEKVQFCGMIDTVPPGKEQINSVDKFTLESESKLIQKLFVDPEMAEKLNEFSSINEIWPLVVEYVEKMNLDITTIRKSIPTHLTKVIPNYDRLSIRELIYYNNVIRTLDHALLMYCPAGKVETEIHFFKASETPIDVEEWGGYALKAIKVDEIPGDHHSILKSGDVKRLSEMFDDLLDECLMK